MEGTLSLDRSLRKEWAVGFIDVPNIITASIPTDISIVMEGSVSNKKGWFVLVRTTRKNLRDIRTEDDFPDEMSKLRAWVGLQNIK